ncbi:hypothetical protein F4777DRAFT_548262 [Nemania sp. FL0916]|nr:hypothetical protein F4777DRAFT_548262 [Nemania sp. FL0916]
MTKRLLLPPLVDKDPVLVSGDPKEYKPDKVDSEKLASDMEDFEILTPLPCGHFFGGECLDAWHEQQAADGKKPTCPLCRFVLVHPGCGCNVYLTGSNHWLCGEMLINVIPMTRQSFVDFSHLPMPKKTVFRDSAVWDPALNSRENNFGVAENCICCEEENDENNGNAWWYGQPLLRW